MSDESSPSCQNCPGTTSITHYSYYECDSCYEPIGKVDAVPEEELAELVESWRECEDSEPNLTGFTYSRCADELEELIKDG